MTRLTDFLVDLLNREQSTAPDKSVFANVEQVSPLGELQKQMFAPPTDNSQSGYGSWIDLSHG